MLVPMRISTLIPSFVLVLLLAGLAQAASIIDSENRTIV